MKTASDRLVRDGAGSGFGVQISTKLSLVPGNIRIEAVTDQGVRAGTF